MRLRHIVVCLLMLFAAHSARAQPVRGTVVDSATASPIAGAVASLLDASGRALVRTITDGQGRFRFADAAGATRLQLLRIGYRPREDRLPTSPGAEITIDARMVQVPRFLESVRVSDRAICPGGQGGAEPLALWEQVRAGLLATVVARDAMPAQVRNLVYQRQIEVRNGNVLSQSLRRHAGMSSRPFVASRPADAFAAEGYMKEDRNGRNYFAPDADVFLDPSFVATHCFRVVFDQTAHPAQVGLGFQPAPGRDTLVDVAGVLWLDRDVPALRTLEFRYTGLEPAGIAAGAGGSLLFRAMPTGVVFIERWKLLMPLFTQTVNAYSPPPTRFRADRRDLVVNRMAESGGELAWAVWPDARWDATLGRVTGQIRMRGSGKTVANVQVWLEGTDERVTTDSTGSFVMTDLLPGTYTMRAADTTLSEFGLSQSKDAVIQVSRENPSVVTLEWQPLADLLTRICREQEAPAGTAPILGRVYLPDGAPATSGVVSAKWQHVNALQSELVSFRDVDRRHDLDAGGRFHLCVPTDKFVRLRATSGEALVRDTTITIPREAPFGLMTMRLKSPAARPN